MPVTTPLAQNSERYVGRGQLLIAPVGTTAWKGLGNAVELQMNTSANRISAMDYQTPGLKEVEVHFQEEKREVTFTVDSVQPSVLSLLLGSAVTTITGATVTAELQTVVAGQEFINLAHNNLTTFTSLTGNSGTPTYVDGTDYEVHLLSGMIKIKNSSTLVTGSPVKANYTYGNNLSLNVGSIGETRWAVMFNGYSDSDPTRVKRLIIPKFALSPQNNFPFIGNDFAKIELTGSALYDPTRGQFAYWEQAA